ncbi:MAG: hypothetical protein R3A10_12210 [Caldilineaceae bacterium]
MPEESEARYSINEVFISDNNALVTAIGRTTAITGSLTLNYADLWHKAPSTSSWRTSFSAQMTAAGATVPSAAAGWSSATFPLATSR